MRSNCIAADESLDLSAAAGRPCPVDVRRVECCVTVQTIENLERVTTQMLRPTNVGLGAQAVAYIACLGAMEIDVCDTYIAEAV